MMSMHQGSAEDLSTALPVVAWIGFGISFAVIALRVWVRTCKLRDRLAAHDVLMVTALVFNLIGCILITLACQWGLGKHQDVLTDRQRFHAERYNTIDEAFLVFAPMFGRISVAVLIHSILGPTRQWAQWVLYTIIAIQVIENIIIVVQAWAQCHNHPSALWDPAMDKELYCDPPLFEMTMAYLSSGFNSLSDLILTAMPAFILLRLNMRARTKVALVAVFALGLVAFAVSVVKAVQNANLSADDFTFQIAYLQIYILVESNVIMWTGSAPTLRPLWKQATDTDYYDESALSYDASRITQQALSQRSYSEATTMEDFKKAEDGASEEYILELPPPPPLPPIEVTRTTVVTVDYDRSRPMGEGGQGNAGGGCFAEAVVSGGDGISGVCVVGTPSDGVTARPMRDENL